MAGRLFCGGGLAAFWHGVAVVGTAPCGLSREDQCQFNPESFRIHALIRAERARAACARRPPVWWASSARRGRSLFPPLFWVRAGTGGANRRPVWPLGAGAYIARGVPGQRPCRSRLSC
ncbi:hypothetical protein RR42_m0822 [Cupriavidus basilensis]|uniref:Uncharacterized protein n=1 Tax=Cupriavidus basilensis TaxID=68895 RepID=A0A0C4Y7U9_9BURK|nr:hypothetical protein RR42_m0822 [Cupriavidus basilensis]